MRIKLLATALLAATLTPALAQAQDYRPDRRDRQELREDRRELREDRRELREDRRDARRDYRQDRREAWQDYRRDHRAEFSRGNWNAPFRYRSFAVGGVAPRSYWGSRYYVNDWQRYRLPRPGNGFYRYVRHYDDLLLINTRNGRVVRVYNRFYW